MTTITPSLDHLYRMLSSDSNRETEFGELLIKIIKKPSIPISKDLLFHPNPSPNKPGQSPRLQKSCLSDELFNQVREQWTKTIHERNLYHDSHGLSYDLFMKMIQDLYGCSDVRDPRMPITREAVNHLVHTGNPWMKSKPAVTLQDYNLQFICCFTQEYTFEQLKQIGEKVLDDYRKLKYSAAKADDPVKLSLDFSLPAKESLYIRHDGKLTNNSENANNLKGLIHNTLIERGTAYFLSFGVPAEELLAAIYDANPKLSLDTLIVLPEALGLSLEAFCQLLSKDKDDLNLGF